MRAYAFKATKYLLFGAILNLGVAWTFALVHGNARFDGRAHHNPRATDPIAFYSDRRFGAEWVVGCGRPGTLVSRHPDVVGLYSREPWWPPEALAMNGEACGMASGWPLHSFAAWRTASVLDRSESVEYEWKYHAGIVLRDEPGTEAGNRIPTILPLQPLWPGLAVNTLVYAVAAAVCTAGLRQGSRHWRRKRGLCAACAYPAGEMDRCSECGETTTAR